MMNDDEQIKGNPLISKTSDIAPFAKSNDSVTFRDCYAMAVVVGMLAHNNGVDVTRVFTLADELLQQRGEGE